MKVIETDIPDVLILEPQVYGDERGFFMESFNQKKFDEAVGRKVEFVQDNHSKSAKNVLRGLHYQIPPYSQGKLVRCVMGEVYDVAVDIREYSSSYGKWVGVHLSAENKRQLWIPEGFAHGFLVLSDSAEFLYKTTNYYHAESDRGLMWNDPDIGIEWPVISSPLLSNKDSNQPAFNKVR
ncbi:MULTISPECIES: dTDP-4-dehydrorhamnose 3,5-epimerase [Pantoea]|uniref:dTDP-4-dehydrorhamnose 3,5-epimerase n=1 Tax=Pantoea TaxID=53335 RepID=UPI00023236BE|nr:MULTISPECIES: dTDP-4-dehydrorhamnose 3,5-epimerase [Pantoea]AER32065.1 dTDP-4-dehydrorhamnose 3,5-epimerase RmlC [Pantoea ananatis PA13]MCW0329443.1 dTDP-4-dehydrorhamnose 3,5-epimerase [Pantoea ananatis]MDF7790948.1 dTDP-4-dehydrorhamnose 3,5-epimerase [Pantoea ananatis]OWY76649.1 dTDP-4-dehydrorhamnose 3,5-epimerase [Pantoea sp. AMG 501]PQL02438.1 dTDP-4-dehydrorhamnose 3,5-epimerase [Pantoea ananatis]